MNSADVCGGRVYFYFLDDPGNINDKETSCIAAHYCDVLMHCNAA